MFNPTILIGVKGGFREIVPNVCLCILNVFKCCLELIFKISTIVCLPLSTSWINFRQTWEKSTNFPIPDFYLKYIMCHLDKFKSTRSLSFSWNHVLSKFFQINISKSFSSVLHSLRIAALFWAQEVQRSIDKQEVMKNRCQVIR